MLRFNVEVENLSNRDMDSMFITLEEVVIFKSYSKHRTEEREVDRLTREEKIRPGSTEYWEGTVRLPPLPPTGLSLVNII